MMHRLSHGSYSTGIWRKAIYFPAQIMHQFSHGNMLQANYNYNLIVLCSQCRTANGSSGRLAGRRLAARQAQEKEKTQAQQQLKQ
jgi:hypothetical protein